jgi:hypothetical protein
LRLYWKDCNLGVKPVCLFHIPLHFYNEARGIYSTCFPLCTGNDSIGWGEGCDEEA